MLSADYAMHDRKCQIVRNFNDLLVRKSKFAAIYCDPPWQYNNTASRAAAVNHYSTMPIDELAALPIGDIAEDNAHLHLWAPSSFLEEALALLKGWGFQYKSSFVWCKCQLGMGNYWRLSHEFLLLGVRGKLVFRERPKSWLICPRTEHSTKPDVIREFIERTSPSPRIELFARRTSPGWTVLGNQIQHMLF